MYIQQLVIPTTLIFSLIILMLRLKSVAFLLPYACWKRMKCQLSPSLQDDRLTFNYLYHVGIRKYQLQNEQDNNS